jgi:hypothetical protein
MRYIFMATLLLALPARADAPSLLSYTGTLADGTGAPVADGSHSLTFRFFSAATGGTALWSETLDATTSGGVFTALLGAGTPFDETILSQAQLWFEIQVESDVLAPRLRVTSVPYALMAGGAAIADSLSCNGCVQAQQIDLAEVQARVSGTPCSAGTAVTAIASDGTASCDTTMIFAGSGTAPTAAHSDHVHTGLYLPAGTTVSCSDPVNEKVVAIDAITGDVTCAADANAAYVSGAGISIAGPTIAVSFAGFSCTGTDKLTGFDALGDPVCAPDVDTNTDTQHTLTQVPRANSVLTVDAPGSVGSYTSITIGTDGMPIISYRDGQGSTQDLRVFHCASPNCSTGAFAVPDGPGDVGLYTSIAIGADGLPIVSYYDQDPVVPNLDLKVAKCADVACATPATVSTVDSGSGNDVGKYTAIAIGTDGLPVISYRDATAMTLKVAHCDDPACLPGGNTITTLDGPNVGEDDSIAIGADGLPVISYRAISVGLKVAKCGDAACSAACGAGTTCTIVDAAATTVGQHTSITVAPDGLPIISHYDGANGDLKVAKCADPTCSTPATNTTIDGQLGADVGLYTAITIGADGLPAISYQDATATALRFVHCGDAACVTGNQFATVDPGPGVGAYTSITIGGDGAPVISYRDVTNGDLKVAKCGNALCLPNWTRR